MRCPLASFVVLVLLVTLEPGTKIATASGVSLDDVIVPHRSTTPSWSTSSSTSVEEEELEQGHHRDIVKTPVVLSAERRLIETLLDGYGARGKMGRPVKNVTQPVHVQFGLGLIQLDLDEKQRILTLSMWTRYQWKDEYMVWDPNDYDNLTAIRLNHELIWKPDIMLYNTAEVQLTFRDSKAVISHTGSIQWYPHTIFRSSCAVDVTNFPFDEQECHMWFGSWTHPKQEIDLHMGFPSGIDLTTFQSDYKESCVWEIANVTAERDVVPSEDVEPNFVILKFHLILLRKHVLSTYILTLPCIFLGCLTLVVFWLPPERPDRTGLAMSIFGSLMFLLLILVGAAPPSANSIPTLGVYYSFNMTIIMFAIVLSSIVVNLSKGEGQPVPCWLHCITSCTSLNALDRAYQPRATPSPPLPTSHKTKPIPSRTVVHPHTTNDLINPPADQSDVTVFCDVRANGSSGISCTRRWKGLNAGTDVKDSEFKDASRRKIEDGDDDNDVLDDVMSLAVYMDDEDQAARHRLVTPEEGREKEDGGDPAGRGQVVKEDRDGGRGGRRGSGRSLNENTDVKDCETKGGHDDFVGAEDPVGNRARVSLIKHITALKKTLGRIEQKVDDWPALPPDPATSRDRQEAAEERVRLENDREWKHISVIIDRLFFFIYIVIIITSLCVLFPRPFNKDDDDDDDVMSNPVTPTGSSPAAPEFTTPFPLYTAETTDY